MRFNYKYGNEMKISFRNWSRSYNLSISYHIYYVAKLTFLFCGNINVIGKVFYYISDIIFLISEMEYATLIWYKWIK